MKNSGRSKKGWFSSRSRKARALRFWASLARWWRSRISSALLVREDSMPFVRLELTGRYSPSSLDNGKVSFDLKIYGKFTWETNLWLIEPMFGWPVFVIRVISFMPFWRTRWLIISRLLIADFSISGVNFIKGECAPWLEIDTLCFVIHMIWLGQAKAGLHSMRVIGGVCWIQNRLTQFLLIKLTQNMRTWMRGLEFQLEFQRKRCTVSSEIRTLFQFKVRKYVKVDRHFFLYQLKKNFWVGNKRWK